MSLPIPKAGLNWAAARECLRSIFGVVAV